MTDFDLIAQGMNEAVPFVKHLGLEVIELSTGEATARLPERVELTNHVGSQHAGALFTLAATTELTMVVAPNGHITTLLGISGLDRVATVITKE